MATHQRDQERELGFDPDSPDLADPQVDPIGPAKSPDDSGNDVSENKRVKDGDYPPYETDE